ncbi:MAG: tryptophan 7-halogenase [Bryobacteraceae bacterium]
MWSLRSTRCGRVEETLLPSWDVAIIGGGPAGSAAALTLRDRYPELSVGILEASLFDQPRAGEVLSPAATPILRQLRILEAVQRVCSRPVHAAAVSWGRNALAESPHLFSPHGPGWHLDRARFDALLVEQAEERGVTVWRGCRASPGKKAPGGWLFHMASGDTATSRFAIDASGRNASVARNAGARLIAIDRLIGFLCFFEACEDEDPRTLIESVKYGWWYTAALRDGVRIAVCMTDADIGRELRLAAREVWLDRLHATVHVAGALSRNSIPTRGPLARSAASQFLTAVCGPDWIAAGDAALALDPLSGQGILAALRSGIFAAYAVGDSLTRGDDSGLCRYADFISFVRTGYVRAREQNYNQEQRWPQSKFWLRRRTTTAVTHVAEGLLSGG